MKEVRTIFGQALALAVLVAPVFAGTGTNYQYLALGDSIAFGYDPTVAVPSPAKYTGYPEVVASIENLLNTNKEVNAACPGETSGSFLFVGALDNGCQAFKALFGLHTNYPGTQASFAVSQLQSNRRINLVTLSIGGNDLLLLEQQCATAASFPTCVGAALPAVLQEYAANLTQILTDIRVQSQYKGTLVLVKNYAVNTDPLFTQTIAAMNQVMTQVGSQFGAKFGDGFGAFQLASILFHGDPCKAGLLIRKSPTTCDVHPSRTGRDILAATVLIATQQ
jgi:lysophospholipase L1-like esterase